MKLAIVAHELKLFLSDRRSVIVGIVTPILLATFFGFLFSGQGRHEAAKIRVVVADSDGSAVSRAVVAGLAADPLLAVTQAANPLHGRPSGRAKRRRRGPSPAGLRRRFRPRLLRRLEGPRDRPPRRPVARDGGRPREGAPLREDIPRGIPRGIRRSLGNEGPRGEPAEHGGRPRAGDARARDAEAAPRDVTRWKESTKGGTDGTNAPARGPGTAVPFTLKEESVTARKGVTYNSYAHSFAGMGIQFLLFVALDFGIAFLLERQGGIWKRLRAAPLSRSSLLAGKAPAGALVGLISVGATFAFGIVVLGVRIQGSIPGFLLILVSSALMASSFGLLLAALGKTPRCHARPFDPRDPPSRHARRRLGPGLRLPRVAPHRHARPADPLGDRRPRRGDVARRRPRRGCASCRGGPLRLRRPLPPRRPAPVPLDRRVGRETVPGVNSCIVENNTRVHAWHRAGAPGSPAHRALPDDQRSRKVTVTRRITATRRSPMRAGT